MIVLDRFSLLAFWRLRRMQASCPCRTVVALRGGRLARLLMGASQISEDHLAKGQVFASFLSVTVTEAMLEQGEIDDRVQQALGRFFGDQHILLAYRKALAQWVQEQLALYEAALQEANGRGCATVAFLPADSQSARVLHCWKSIPREFPTSSIDIVANSSVFLLTRLQALFWSWLLGCGLLLKAAALVGRQGVTLRAPKRQHFLAALPNYWGVSAGRPWSLRSVDFLVDGRAIHRQDILAIFFKTGKTKDERKRLHDLRKRQYTDAGIAWAMLAGPPVPLRLLLSLMVRICHALLLLWLPAQSIHPVLRRRAMGIILYGVQLEVFLQHYAVKVILNVEEHSCEHIVETVVVNKFGGRTVWVPNTVAFREGFYLSYLHYDLVPVQGWLPVEAYGKTWSPHAAIKPVGVTTNDAASLPDEVLATEPVRRLIQGLGAHAKIVGAFTGSFTSDQFIRERNLRFLTVLSELVDQEQDLKVIIKPKASEENPDNSYFLVEEPFRSVLEKGLREKRIFILDPRQGLSCTAQYLMNASDVVVSTGQYAAFGSVWVEALLLGKPSYVFAPSEFRSGPTSKALFDRWLFDDVDKMRDIVLEGLKRPQSRQVDRAIQHWFDPFNDGRAIERLRAEILHLAGEEYRLACAPGSTLAETVDRDGVSSGEKL